MLSSRRKRTRLIRLGCALFLSALLLFFFGIVPASAHAKVIDANPKIGSTISQVPSTVTVFTAENVDPDPSKSNLFVYGPSGELISQGNATIPLNNPREMSVRIKPDGNGVYIVRWITVSAEDGDPAEGAFIFTVKPAGASSTLTTPTPAPSSTTSNSATSSSGAGGTSNLPLWVSVAGIAGLLVGGGAGLGLGRSLTRQASSSSSFAQMRRQIAREEEKDTTPRG
ncbi:copper resistance CopC family protein [Thermogemmatispora sp.]|uniref:copper resistance CopC family protein n=1 Tax=Thermogemmatispora sp. TaxID=1968838 RepID=UPI001DF741CB|nr:copper resistance CopC family protein [Thermogemmatispora sp.]MBX5450161.1 copper resistance protein CopC [Thermogemmatispora sp.]